MTRTLASCLSVLLLAAGAAAAQDPPPQLSAEELERAFAQPGQPAPASGDCERQGMVTGPGGACEQVTGNRRGFSLPSPNRPNASTPRTGAPAAAPRTPATAAASTRPRPAAAAAVAGPAARSRDLLITFAKGSTELTAQARANARVFAEVINRATLRDARFAIDGHTDSSGGRDLNLRLSRERAQAVVEFLAALGVDRSRLEANGYGFDRPIAGNARSPANRRVEARRLN
jgi:outer membrane protein OmpA-like peptidoglycan-associated protein